MVQHQYSIGTVLLFPRKGIHAIPGTTEKRWSYVAKGNSNIVLLDEDQTIHVPKVWTSAIDSDTFTKTSFADGSTTIIDTFSYENLIPGFTYELKGYVLDKNQSITTGTNVTVLGTDGRLAQNSVVFTPESSAGRQGFRLRWIRGSSARKITTA